MLVTSAVNLLLLLLPPHGKQPEVCQLEDEPAVHHTVGALEVPMVTQIGRVEVTKALKDIIHQRLLEVPVNLHLVLLQDVLEGSPRAVLRDQHRVDGVQAGAIEPDQIVVLQVLDLLQLYQEVPVQAELVQLDPLDGHPYSSE